MCFFLIECYYNVLSCREKADRANDPNVEYVDMDDFRPGGKYGPQSDGDAAVKVSEMQVATEVAKASAVLAEMQVSLFCAPRL